MSDRVPRWRATVRSMSCRNLENVFAEIPRNAPLSGKMVQTWKTPATAGTVPGTADFRGVDMDQRSCAVDGCQKPAHARGWCGTHYQRWRATGDVRMSLPIDRPPVEVCSVDGCGRPHECRGWCKGHYSRWVRYGDVRADKPLREMRQATRPCEADGCQKPGTDKGLCSTHRRRQKLWGSVEDRQGPTLEERFWSKVNKTATCWVWTGYTGNGEVYGQISVNNKPRLAHRLAYELLVGPIPPGRVIDHLCRVRSCVNPAHMEVVSNGVNVLRGESPTAVAYRTGQCVRGHEFTPENTYRWPKRPFTRACKTCARDRRRARAQRKTEGGQ